jgi:hypothetical protein
MFKGLKSCNKHIWLISFICITIFAISVPRRSSPSKFIIKRKQQRLGLLTTTHRGDVLDIVDLAKVIINWQDFFSMIIFITNRTLAIALIINVHRRRQTTHFEVHWLNLVQDLGAWEVKWLFFAQILIWHLFVLVGVHLLLDEGVLVHVGQRVRYWVVTAELVSAHPLR